jgi:hypothetical protein
LKYSFGLVVLLLASSCEWPFDTQATLEDAIFQITAEVSTTRLVDSAFVDLFWPTLGFDNFKEFVISRRYLNPVDTSQSTWHTRARIINPYVATWRDTIYDDESLRYQVAVVLTSGPYGSSEVEVRIEPTTRIVVPTDNESLRFSILTPLIDSGDSVLVLSGAYTISDLLINDKAINLIGVDGARTTILERDPASADTIMIQITDCLIRGFTIRDGVALFGGGIYAAGSSLIRQCILRRNGTILGSDQPWGGFGGGLHLFDQARVENCLITLNHADKLGGGILIDANAVDVRITNCTIYANEAVGMFADPSFGTGGGIAALSGSATIENCIVVENSVENISPPPESPFAPRVSYSNAGSTWLAADITNISGDPTFENPRSGNFRLRWGSPCINSGNPDPVFNDPDGSRNDMGAYGGRFGDW